MVYCSLLLNFINQSIVPGQVDRISTVLFNRIFWIHLLIHSYTIQVIASDFTRIMEIKQSLQSNACVECKRCHTPRESYRQVSDSYPTVCAATELGTPTC